MAQPRAGTQTRELPRFQTGLTDHRRQAADLPTKDQELGQAPGFAVSLRYGVLQIEYLRVF